MNYIVMGPQGSGKSTQAELLAKKLNLPHLQTGELYRRTAKQNSLVGKRIRKVLNHGELVADEDHVRLLKSELAKSKYKKGFVLDGSPRTLNQAKIQSFKIDKVFYLKVSDQENIKRLVKRKRKDDTPELIKNRLKIYHCQTEPVLDYYRQMGILEKVDVERPIEEIHQEMMIRAER